MSAPSSELLPEPLRWVLLILGFFSLFLGAWGIWLYEETAHKETAHKTSSAHVEEREKPSSSSTKIKEPALDGQESSATPDSAHEQPAGCISAASRSLFVLYHTLQLLLGHGAHLAEPIPWQLHFGRIFGVCFVLAAVGYPYYQLLQRQLIQVPPRSVVICGLGDFGMKIAIAARQRGKHVVAIEKLKNEATEQALRQEIKLIEGDALHENVLRRAHLDRSESLLVSTENDATNEAIARQAGSLIVQGSRQDSPLICRVLVRDPLFWRQPDGQQKPLDWGQSATGPRPDYRVNLLDLVAMHDEAIRQALRKFPLDIKPIQVSDDTRVHLVVVGFGRMGQALALQAARIGHFANETPTRKIRITVVDANVKSVVKKFKEEVCHSKLDECCEFNEHDLHHSRPGFTAELDGLLQRSGPGEWQTIVFCLESATTANDEENCRLGLEFANLTNQERRRLLTNQTTRSGYDTLLRNSASQNSQYLHPFGMVEDLFTWDLLQNKTEDKIASAIHEDYVKHHGGDSWETLSENLKDSNRHAADHVPIKLRALGYHDAPLVPDQARIEHFSESEKLLMAKMEHERWCAERFLDGWKYGPETIRAQKISKALVSWEELPIEEQRKDFEQIEALPRILLASDLGIYR